MKRWGATVRIVVSFVLGIALLYAPWLHLWTHNHFAAHYGWVASVCRNGYLRGAISGLGVTDIWLALEDIRHAFQSPGRGATP